ncbi:hypothetical protein [Phenylobacterium sp.]|uniref:hypothetical protein n=1 Tax=Phenylobacterium sp. TaxID=1871053 RepID=UPI0030F3985A
MDLVIIKRTLGVVSLGLGLVAVAAPRRLAKFVGLSSDEESVATFGAREIAAGAGLLSPVRPGPWFWLRVGGDAMFLFTLGKATGRDNPKRGAAMAAAVVVGAVVAVDILLAAHAMLNRHEDEAAAQ